jgi:SanA protein
LLGLACAFAVWVGVAALSIEPQSAPYVKARSSELPTTRVGLVLGCAQRMPDGKTNQFFDARMRAAAELYRAGKVSYLLVSGDNSRSTYDEPGDMRRALEHRGVPRSRIVLDYAGFRTLDSVVRAKQVFALERFIVISQHFHAVRAVYLARAHGIDAYGFEAADIGGAGGAMAKLREVASRVFAVLDVTFDTSPRFLGARERAFIDEPPRAP